MNFKLAKGEATVSFFLFQLSMIFKKAAYISEAQGIDTNVQ